MSLLISQEALQLNLKRKTIKTHKKVKKTRQVEEKKKNVAAIMKGAAVLDP
jgi:hypothetical protein